MEFPFKKGRGEGNKGERGKGKEKINLLDLNFSPKSPLSLKSGKEKRENQSIGVALRQSI